MSATVPKFIDDPADVVRTAVDTFCITHSHCKRIENTNVLINQYCDPTKVLLISGGGAGHEPAHGGFVGRGWLSAAVCGNVFASPPSSDVSAAIDYLNQLQKGHGPGILVVVKNYAGDVINFGYAVQQAKQRGIAVEMVLVADDVSCGIADPTKRRGIAGTVLTYKMLGAAALSGEPLTNLVKLAHRIGTNIRSLGASLSSCAVPGNKASSTIPDGKLEIGLGIHGEKGMKVVDAMPSTQLVDVLIDTLLSGRGTPDGEMIDEWGIPDKLVMVINNLGGTTDLEMFNVTSCALTNLRKRGFIITGCATTRAMTALEMHGFSITLLRCEDEDFKYLTLSEQRPYLNILVPLAAPGRVPGPPSALQMAQTHKGANPEESTAVRQVAESIFSALEGQEAFFNGLDADVGDGDLGSGVCRASRAVLELTALLPWKRDLKAAFTLVSKAVADSCGGTSGPLYGAFILGAAAAGIEELHKSQNSVCALRCAIAGGMKHVTRLGGAVKGDRTMVDALAAVVDSEAVQAAETVPALMAAAVTAAKEGAQAASMMVAKMGRARYMGGKEVGVKEPGCELVVMWMELIQKATSQ